MRKMIQYKVVDDGCIGYTTNGKEFFFDKEDIRKIIAHNWYASSDDYIVTNVNIGHKWTKCYLHNYLLNETDPNIIVYHIDGNRFNNRKSNLGKRQLHTTRYEIIDGEYVGYTAKGEPFYFDQEDLEKVVSHTWLINNNGYLVASVCVSPRKYKTIYLHRYLLDEYDPNTFIEFIDGNKLNNHKSNLRKKIKGSNWYEITDNICIGHTSKDELFYFDKEDLEKVAKYTWHKNADGYIVTKVTIDPKRRIFVSLHRYLMRETDCDVIIDHIDGNPSNNCKANLRRVNSVQNAHNRKISKANTSGITGVYLRNNINKWYAYISIDGKRKHLGCFDSKEEAIQARKEAEEKYFGEYARKTQK